MAEALVLFGLGLVLLALGGDSIVKGASGLAQKFGASPFIAGLLLIAFGTSIPELFVNARIECEAKPGSKGHFTVDIGDYVAAQPGLGEVVMFYVHDYLEDDSGCTYVLLRDEEVLE